MRFTPIKELRNLNLYTEKVSQGTKSSFWAIGVQGGQPGYPQDTLVETSNKAVKLDGPTLIAMDYLKDIFKETPGIDESVVMRLGFAYFAQKMGCDHPAIIEQAELFESLWTNS